MYLYDLDRKRAHELVSPKLPRSTQDFTTWNSAVREGGHVFVDVGTHLGEVNRKTGTYIIPLNLHPRVHRISPALFSSAIRPDRIWFWTELHEGMNRGTTEARVWEANLRGERVSPSFVVQGLPIAEVHSGILVDLSFRDEHDRLTVVDPRTGRRVRVVARRSAWRPVAVSPDFVAWREGRFLCGFCPLHVTDVRTGRDRVVSIPRGAMGFDSYGAFSPDERVLAVAMAGVDHGLVILIDVRSATARILRGSGWADGPISWNRSGRWLFFGRHSHPIGAWRRGTGAAVRLGRLTALGSFLAAL